MLCLGYGITDDIFQEYLEDTTGFFVDQPGDTYDTTSFGKTADGWFCDNLDIITQHFPVTLGSFLSQTFSTFFSTGHIYFF